jgi:hypothetical protein
VTGKKINESAGELEPKEDRREKDNRWKELKKMGSGERGEGGENRRGKTRGFPRLPH